MRGTSGTGSLLEQFDVLQSMRKRARATAAAEFPDGLLRPSHTGAKIPPLGLASGYRTEPALGAAVLHPEYGMHHSNGLHRLGPTDASQDGSHRHAPPPHAAASPRQGPGLQQHVALTCAEGLTAGSCRQHTGVPTVQPSGAGPSPFSTPAMGNGSAAHTPLSNGPFPFAATAVASGWCIGSSSPVRRDLGGLDRAKQQMVSSGPCGSSATVIGLTPGASAHPVQPDPPAAAISGQLAFPESRSEAVPGQPPRRSQQRRDADPHHHQGQPRQPSGPISLAGFHTPSAAQHGASHPQQQPAQHPGLLQSAGGSCSATQPSVQQHCGVPNLLMAHRQERRQNETPSQQLHSANPTSHQVPSSSAAAMSPSRLTSQRASIVPALAAQLQQHPQVRPQALDVIQQFRQAISQEQQRQHVQPQQHSAGPGVAMHRAHTQPMQSGANQQGTWPQQWASLHNAAHVQAQGQAQQGVQCTQAHGHPHAAAPPLTQQPDNRQAHAAPQQHSVGSGAEPHPRSSAHHAMHHHPHNQTHHQPQQEQRPAQSPTRWRPSTAPSDPRLGSPTRSRPHALHDGSGNGATAGTSSAPSSRAGGGARSLGDSCSALQLQSVQHAVSDWRAPPSAAAQHSLPAYPASASIAVTSLSPASAARAHSAQLQHHSWREQPQPHLQLSLHKPHGAQASGVASTVAAGPREAHAELLRIRRPREAHDSRAEGQDGQHLAVYLDQQQQQHQMSGQDSCATPDGAAQEEVEARDRASGAVPSPSTTALQVHTHEHPQAQLAADAARQHGQLQQALLTWPGQQHGQRQTEKQPRQQGQQAPLHGQQQQQQLTLRAEHEHQNQRQRSQEQHWWAQQQQQPEQDLSRLLHYQQQQQQQQQQQDLSRVHHYHQQRQQQQLAQAQYQQQQHAAQASQRGLQLQEAAPARGYLPTQPHPQQQHHQQQHHHHHQQQQQQQQQHAPRLPPEQLLLHRPLLPLFKPREEPLHRLGSYPGVGSGPEPLRLQSAAVSQALRSEVCSPPVAAQPVQQAAPVLSLLKRAPLLLAPPLSLEAGRAGAALRQHPFASEAQHALPLAGQHRQHQHSQHHQHYQQLQQLQLQQQQQQQQAPQAQAVVARSGASGAQADQPAAVGYSAQAGDAGGLRQLSLNQVKAEVLGDATGTAGQPLWPGQQLQQQQHKQAPPQAQAQVSWGATANGAQPSGGVPPGSLLSHLPHGASGHGLATFDRASWPSAAVSPAAPPGQLPPSTQPAFLTSGQLVSALPHRPRAPEAPPPRKRAKRADGRPPLPPAPQRDAARGIGQLFDAGAAAAAAAIHAVDRLLANTRPVPDPGTAAAAAAIQTVDLMLAKARPAPSPVQWHQQQGQQDPLVLLGGGGHRIGYDSGSETGSESATAGELTALARRADAAPPRQRRTSNQGGRRGPAAAAGDGQRTPEPTPEELAEAEEERRRREADAEAGCSRARAIDMSRLGKHRHKPPPVLFPIRPGFRPEQVTANAGASNAAAAVPAAPPPPADATAPDGDGATEDCDGAAARRSKRPIKAPVAFSPPRASGAAGGIRLPRHGRLGADTTRALLSALREAKALLHSRFMVRRSSIAQLGVFAAATIPPDTLLMEYYGEGVRSSVADLREKRYNDAGLGCYLFNPGGSPDEAVVLDATHKGNIMRFVNHSCGPNCTARTVVVEGQRRIFLFSKSELTPGTELTYDYKLSSALCLDMFKGLPEEMIEQAAEETGVELLLCQCGTKGCRKYL